MPELDSPHAAAPSRAFTGVAQWRRALAVGAVLIALHVPFDLRYPQGGRAALWRVTWAVAFVVAWVLLDPRRPRRSVLAIEAAAALSGVCATGILWYTGGSANVRLGFLLVLPALVSLVLLDLPRAAAVTAAVTFGGGFAILARDGAGAGAFLEWALLCLVVASFLALGASTFGRLWRSELAARQAEADALTRLAESERQRASAERLAAVGRLAADVAHQVGSPIASVRSNLGFLDEELARQGCGAEAAAALRESREAVERVSAIVSELRAQVAEEPAPRGRP